MSTLAGAQEPRPVEESAALDGATAGASVRERSLWLLLDWVGPLAIMALHLALALYAVSVGVSVLIDPDRNTWDYWWQTLPTETLLHNLGQAMVYLHMQPPLYNLWGALHLRLFGESAVAALQWSQIGLGVLTCGMYYPIGRAMGLPRGAALAAGALLAALPSLVLYEAYSLYESLTLFLVTATLFGAALFHFRRTAWTALLTVVALNLLMMTRSSFHLLLVAPVTAVLLIAARAHRLRILLLVILVTLPTVAWYAKNQAIFGFFGASSWMGMNLFRASVRNLPPDTLEEYVASGAISQMTVDQPKGFRRPELYLKYGYTKTSPIAVLNEDDLNNINTIDTAREYQRSAINLIRAEPANYLRNVGISYTRFNWLASGYEHLVFNRAQLPAWWLGYERAIYGLPWMERFGSISYWLIPLIQVELLLVWLLRRWKQHESLLDFVRAMPAVLIGDGLLVYALIVATLLEYGENDRFRFAVEPLIWLLAAGLAAHLVRIVLARNPERGDTGDSTLQLREAAG